MAIWALAGTLAFSFLLELIGASAANSSGWGIVGAIAAQTLTFNGCTGLKSVTLNNGLRKIGKSAFKNCRMLTLSLIHI